MLRMVSALLLAALALAASPAVVAQPPADHVAGIADIAGPTAIAAIPATLDAAATAPAAAPAADRGVQFTDWLARQGAPGALAANAAPPPCPNPLSICKRCAQLGFGCCFNQAAGCYGCC